MGLELVELLLEVERRFDVRISDREAEGIRTGRDLVDYLDRRLRADQPGPCLSQRAFYSLRGALRRLGLAPPHRLNAGAALGGLLPPTGRRAAWKALGRALAAELPRARLVGEAGPQLDCGFCESYEGSFRVDEVVALRRGRPDDCSGGN